MRARNSTWNGIFTQGVSELLSSQGRSKTHFSVVIPTHERPSLAKASIDSVLDEAKRYGDEAVDIVVVNSSIKSLDLGQKVREIHCPGKSRAASKRNIGIAEARSEWIVFLDDDCKMAAGALSSIADFITKATTDVAAFYGATEFAGERSFALKSLIDTHLNGDFSWALWMEEMLWGPTSLAVFRRSALEEVHGFDEGFAPIVGGEDVDIGIRLHDARYRLLGIPATLVYHDSYTWNSLRGNMKRFFRYGMADTSLQIKRPRFVYLKTNTVMINTILNVAVMIAIFAATANLLRSVLVPPIFVVVSYIIGAVIYSLKYRKPPHQALTIRLYERASEWGKLYAALGHKKPKPLFHNAKYMMPNEREGFLGRNTVMDLDEVPDLLSVITTLVILLFL
ncbi:MAG: glycosyltransferase [Candidatus Thorarchaeota archaeon]|nr:glycosyltransferase [Candidatus Thorarchaeota archaeon]